jgi:phenylalanyl-tRNA synthetase beta chain
MVTSLAERGGSIESLVVKYPDESTYTTPDLKPKVMKVSKDDIIAMTGMDLSDVEIVDSLEKMCYGAKISAKGIVSVQVPQYRTDILHAVDIIEDVAIGYGFDRIVPTMPSTMTAGRLRPLTRQKNKARDLMVGLGYQEILSYIMTSPLTLNDKMLRSDALVETGNPKSRDYSVLRNSLLPIVLDFVSQNQHVDLPHYIFEVGDIVKPDEAKETRTQQVTSVCGLKTDVKVNLTTMMNEIGFLLRGMGLEGRFEYQSGEDSSFIDGRCGIIAIDNESIGIFGEISPEVLSNFEMGTPVIAFEIVLPESGEW